MTSLSLFILYGVKLRYQQQLCDLFNVDYPDEPIRKSTVSNIEKKSFKC